jgi:guanylate kinase
MTSKESVESAKLVIVIGPSGVGKSSFIDRILREEKRLKDLTTYTTREMRKGEKEGDPYHFVPRARFEELVDQGFFVEWANVHGQLYGTPWDQIRDSWKSGMVVIMDIDVQGAKHFRKVFPNALTIFLAAPSLDSLRQRILKRGAVGDVDTRLETAKKEMAAARDFDHLITNDEFEPSYQRFRILIEKFLENQ